MDNCSFYFFIFELVLDPNYLHIRRRKHYRWTCVIQKPYRLRESVRMRDMSVFLSSVQCNSQDWRVYRNVNSTLVLLFSEYQETMIVWDSGCVFLIGEGLHQEGSLLQREYIRIFDLDIENCRSYLLARCRYCRCVRKEWFNGTIRAFVFNKN